MLSFEINCSMNFQAFSTPSPVSEEKVRNKSSGGFPNALRITLTCLFHFPLGISSQFDKEYCSIQETLSFEHLLDSAHV